MKNMLHVSLETKQTNPQIISQTNKLSHFAVLFLQLTILFFSLNSYAQSPQITYHGRLIDGVTNIPVTAAVVTFRLQIRTPGAENCLLFEEQHTKNLSTTDGVFVLGVNNGSGTRMDTSGFSLEQIFSNKQSFSFAGGQCVSGTTYAPGYSDARRMLVYFNDGSFAGWEPLPSQTLAYTPMAVESLNVGGFPAASLLRFVDGTGAPFNTSPLNNTQYTQLTALIGGTSTQYVQAGGIAGGFSGALSGDVTGTQGATVTARLNGTPVSAAPPALGQYLIFNGTNWAAQNGSGGTVTNVSSGNAYMTVVNPTLAPVLTINVGTVANTVAAGDDARIIGAFQTATPLTGDITGNLPTPTVAVVGGRTAAEINTSVTDTQAATDAATPSVLVKRDPAGNSSFTSVQATNVSGRNMYFFDGTNANSINIRAPAAAIGSNLTWTLPNNNGAAGNVLATDGTGNLAWQSATAGSVTSVTATSPLSSTLGFTPNISIQVANGAQDGYLNSADWTTFNNKLATTLGNGFVWVGNAGNVATQRFLNVSDVKSSVAGNWFAGGACPTGQALTYSPVTDQVTCQAYALTSAQVTSALTFTPLNQVLGDTQIFVGNAGNIATGVNLSGDATIANTGALTIVNNAITTAKINNGAVTNAKINDVAWGKITATPTTIAGYGITDTILINGGGIADMSAASFAARPAPGTLGRVFISNDTQEIFRDNGVAWVRVGSSDGLGGTVTNVTGTSPISVATGTSTPVVSMTQADNVTAGYLSSADWTTFNNKLSTTLNTGLVWVGNGANVATPRSLNITDIKSTVAGNWFAGANCPVGQMLTFSAASDQITCQAYSLTSSQVTTALTYTPLNQVLNDTQIFVGNPGNVAAGVALSGDATIANTGALTITNNAITTAKINNNAVTNAKINDVAWSKITSTPTTVAGYGIIDAILVNGGGITEMSAANFAARPAPGTLGRVFISNDTQEIFRDNGVAWVRVGSSNGLGGTVTNVTGTSPVSVATGTTTPVVSMAQSNTTTDGYLSSVDWTTFNSKQTSTLNNGQVWVGNVGNVATARSLNVTDIKSSAAGNWFAGAACPSGQTLTYSAITDQVTCQAYALTLGQVTAALTFTPLTQTLTNTQIFVGNGLNVATGVALTGDAAITNTGVLTIGNNAITTAKINNSAVTNAKINDVAWGKITGTPTTIAGYGITDSVLINGGGIADMSAGTFAALPAPGTLGRVYISNDTQEIFRDNGVAWIRVGSSNGLGGTVTSVTGAGPISVATGTTTPVVSMTAANTTTDGYLTTGDWNIFNNKMNSALTNTQIFVGNGSNVATGVALSGDATIANTGALTIVNNAITNVKINNGAVTDAKINDVAFTKITGLPTTVTGYGITDAVRNVGVGAGNIVSTFQSGNTAGRPGFGTDGRIYIDTQAGITYRDSGTGWVNIGSANGTGGTVTSITAGAGLTGGTITTTGTIGLGTELTGLSGLSTTGIVKRTGVGAYSVSAVDLTTADVTGTLPVGSGGTGATTNTVGSLLVGNGAAAVTSLAGGSAGNLVYATGAATWASGSPDAAGVVDKTSIQTVSGAKTFSNVVTMGPNGVVAGDGGQVRFNELVANGANYVALRSPDALAGNVIWTLPAADGTVGQILQTNGSGLLGWTNAATGTVTSVTSANVDIAVATTTTTPVLTLNSGTGANQIVKLNGASELPAVSGANLTNLNASAVTSGTLTVPNGGTGVASIGSGNIVIGSGVGAVTSLAGGSNGNVVYATGASSFASGSPDTAGLVDKTSVQSISGAKTFGATVKMSNQNLFQLGDSGANQISMRAPATVTANYTLTWPAAVGGAGNVLSSDASGNLSWLVPNAGTVTSVSGTAPISVATGTTTPVVSMTQSNTTTPGYVSAADWNTFNNKLTSTLNSTQIFVGNGTNVATAVNLSGDAGISNTGALTIANNAITTVKINNLAVTDAKINDVAFSKITGLPTTVSGYGITDAVRNVGVGAGNIVSTFQSGNTAGRPAFGTDGRIYIDTQAGITYRDSGSAWVNIGSATGSGGTVTSIIAGTGLTGGTITSTGTIGLGTELTGLNGLATTGIVKRTGAGTYSASAVDVSTSDITGTLPVSNGGTGATTLATGSLVVGNGTNAVNALAGGSAGNLVYATGAASWSSGTPDTAGVVDKTSTQSISGAKTFSNVVTMAPTGVAAGSGGQVRFNELAASGANYVGFKSPDTLAADVIWTLPIADGTAGQVLQTSGAGVLSWANLGTVTSVTSANADIAVATTTTTPVLTLNSGTGANQIVKLTAASKYPAVDGSLITNLDAGNIAAGTLPVGRGGTGATTIGSGNIVIGNGTGAVTSLAGASSGNVVYATGVSTWASGSADTAGLVDKTSTQSISGAKTFGNTVRMSNQNLFQLGDSGANQISMRAPATVTGNYTLTWPAAVGGAGNVLSTDASGNLSWLVPNPGTVTSVSGTAPISVATGTSTPVVSMTQANTSTAGYISSTDWNTFNDKLSTALTSARIFVGNGSNVATGVAMSGDATLSNAGAITLATVTVGKGGTGATTLTTNGVVLGNGTSAVNVTAAGAADSVLRVPAGGGAPVFGAIDLTKAAAVTGALPIANGGTNAITAAAAFNNLSPITTKGDLIAGNGANSNTRLAVGTNGQQLQADSTAATGVKWATAQGIVFAAGAKTTVVVKNTIVYNSPSGVDTPNATVADHVVIIPTAGTCRDLYVITNTANGIGSTMTLTIQKGTTIAGLADTALTVSIGTAAAAGTYSDTTNTFTAAAGDILVVKAACNNVNSCASLVGTSFRCIP